MEWISVKDDLPISGDIVLIKSKWHETFLCVARFLDNYTTLEGDYENIFVIISPPKIFRLIKDLPKYKKSSIIKKEKVQEWMAIPDAHIFT